MNDAENWITVEKDMVKSNELQEWSQISFEIVARSVALPRVT